MIKYYRKAIDLKNSYAMTSLGNYYKTINKYNISMYCTSLMKQYYKMAIKLNNSYAMTNLGNYYYQVKKYDKMIKYYKKAIKLDNLTSMYNIANYYKEINNYKKMKYYYLLLLSKASYDFIIKLNDLYLTLLYQIFTTKMKVIENHFNYAYNSYGYIEAYNSFNLLKKLKK